MTLKEQFIDAFKSGKRFDIQNAEVIADEFATGFLEWSDNNFLMYKDKTYYVNTSSQYFDITKYAGKEKPTKYYTLKELLEIYKKEKGL